jgi:hypothetical protein
VFFSRLTFTKKKETNMKNLIQLSAAVLAMLLVCHPARSQTLAQIKKTVASDRAAFDIFGHSVAIAGDYMVVGAYGEAEDASGGNTLSSAGSVYVFKKDQGGTDNWGQIKKIVASDRAGGDYFGWSVAIAGDYIVVGACYEDHDASGGSTLSNAGSVYVFQKDQGGTDNWGQIKKIVASDRGATDYFGYSVAIAGDYIVVGAHKEAQDASGGTTLSDAGSAYVFQKDTGGTDNWGQIKKIVASDRAADDFFGYSVAIAGDYIVVGAYQEDEDASGANTLSVAGSAYVFQKDTGGTDNWGQIKKIVASVRAGYDKFGHSVAIAGDYIVVGAYLEDEDASGGNTLSNTGSAYVFKKDQGGTNNWGQLQKIVASDRATNDFFGYSVAIAGDYIVVGAPNEDEDASGANYVSYAGSAYVFKKDQGGTDNWGQLQKIVASDRAADDYFGRSVAIAGDYIVVGVFMEDEDASGGNTMSNAGSAYVFKPTSGGLPVDLVYFEAKAIDNQQALLHWQTASELNNNYFDVERSYDAIHWEWVGKVVGNGTTNQLEDYNFIDKTIAKSQQTAYYRLNQIDYDGAHEYTDIRSVSFTVKANAFEIAAYPNPFNQEVTIRIRTTELYSIEVTDLNGLVMLNIENEDKGTHSLDLSTWASGVYIVNVTSKQGTKHLKVMKQ